MPGGDQVPHVADGRRHPALQPDRVAHALGRRGVPHRQGFGRGASERPLGIDVLAGVDGGHDGVEVAGHADAHRDHVHIGVPRQFHRVGEGVGGAVMAGGDLG